MSDSKRHRSSKPTPTPATPANDSAVALARRAATLALDAKAEDVLILDLRGVADVTDCLVIASGTSDTHVRGVAHRVMEALAAEGVKPHHVEGLEHGRWVLIDYVDVIVHLFHPRLREFYQLERLWGDARAVELEHQEALE